MPDPEALLAAVWITVTGVATGWSGVRIARLTDGDAGERALVGLTVAITQVVAVGLALGLVLQAAPAPVLLGHLAATGLVHRLSGVRPAGAAPVERHRPAWSPLGPLLAVVALLAVMTMASLRPGPSQEPDTGNYHYANLAHLLQTDGIWGLAWQRPAYATATHPGNADIVAATLTGFGLASDALVLALSVPFAALAALGIAQLARELGGRRALGALAAAAVLGTPIVFATATRSLTTDLAAGAPIAVAVALVLRAERVGRPTPLLVLAGAAVGLAAGAKYSAFAPAVLVLGFAFVRMRRQALALLPGLVLLVGPWLVRNLLETGNPLFPLGVEIAGLELLRGADTPLRRFETPILGHVLDLDRDVVGRWLRMVWLVLGPAVLLLLAGLGAALAKPGRRRAVAVVAAGCLLCYAVTPFTGGGASGEVGQLASNLRYALPALVLLAALAASALPWPALVFLALWAIVDAAAAVRAGVGGRSDLDVGAPIVVAVVATVVLVMALARAPAPRVPAWAMGAAGIVPLLPALALTIDRVDARVREGRPIARAVAAAQARTGTTDPVIAVNVPDVRPLLGDDLDVPLTSPAGGGVVGEAPPPDAATLDRALAERPEKVLVTSPGDGITTPEGWVPDESWCPVDAGGDVGAAGEPSETGVYVARGTAETVPPAGVAPPPAPVVPGAPEADAGCTPQGVGVP